MKQKLIIVTGPTGSGKTELAIKLAKKFNGEIIGADSRQIYRGMKIGTAAPCIEATKRHNNAIERHGVNWRSDGVEMASIYKGVRHHLVGFLEPDKIFSVAEFKEMALKIASDIIRRGKVPIICGGTAFYLHALTGNLEIPRVLPDWKLRKKLEKKNLKILIRQLKKLDNAALKIVDLKNKRRIVRAIEVCLAGYKFSEFGKKGKPLFNALQIGVDVPREELYKRIDKRVEKMIKGGLIQETKRLVKYFLLKSSSISPTTFSSLNHTELKHGTTQNFQSEGVAHESARKNLPSDSEGVAHESARKNFQSDARKNFPCGSVLAPLDKSSLSNGVNSVCPALSGIGYGEILAYLNGETTLDEASQLIKYRTHKYVRGQMGWFRKNKKIHWVRNYQEARANIKKFLSE